MELLDLAKGKKILVKTDVGVDVELTIKEIKQNNHSRDLEPATAANDWWPATQDWTTYTVFFTNGYKKEYSSMSDIKLID